MKNLKNKTVNNHELAKMVAKAKASGEVVAKHVGDAYCDSYYRIGNTVFRKVSEFNWQEIGQIRIQRVGDRYEVKYY